jgi:uncharacterized protein (UPF0276 family)
MTSAPEHPAPRMGLPDLGVGVGLRSAHYAPLRERDEAGSRPVDWLEIISENYAIEGGAPVHQLARVLERGYPVVQHGVSLSLGGVDPLDRELVKKLRALLRVTKSPWVSDHLCFCGAGGAHLHDLLPLPYTDEVVEHVARRAREVQDALEVRLVLENVSSYLTYAGSTMPEWDFVRHVAEEADCGLLLDVNNVYVSSRNHGFDAAAYLRGIPRGRVVQMHLAGHTDLGDYLLDTHSAHVAAPVWELYRLACERFGPVSTLIEWDEDIPSLDVLVAEAERARVVRAEASHEPA